MYFADMILLVGVRDGGKDTAGNQILQHHSREVFADVQSISQGEYFRAAQTGMNVQYKVVMRSDDYAGERIAELNGVRYRIYRTYHPVDNDRVELYLQEM